MTTSSPEEATLPPGWSARAWTWLRPLVRREKTATGVRLCVRTARLFDVVARLTVALVLAAATVIIWWLALQSIGMNMVLPALCTCVVLVATAHALWTALATAFVDIDRHRVTLDETTVLRLADIVGIEPIVHGDDRVVPKPGAAQRVGPSHDPARGRRYDVVILAAGGRELYLPIRVARQAEAQSLVDLLRRTMEDARVLVGYRDPACDEDAS